MRLLLNQALGDLKDAWAPVMPVGFEYVRSEEDPHFANIAAPSEVVVVSRFQVSIEEAGGELHVIMPYSMVEAVRPPLEGGNGGGTDTDGSWPRMLQDQLKRA